MNHEKFDELKNSILNRLDELMSTKGNEYASKLISDDRLIAFKTSAQRQGITSLEALRGMWDKHIGSIYDFIERAAKGEIIKLETWKEKLNGAEVYLILIEALVIDEGYCYEETKTLINHDAIRLCTNCGRMGICEPDFSYLGILYPCPDCLSDCYSSDELNSFKINLIHKSKTKETTLSEEEDG